MSEEVALYMYMVLKYVVCCHIRKNHIVLGSPLALALALEIEAILPSEASTYIHQNRLYISE
jgi:hypothetical protein